MRIAKRHLRRSHKEIWNAGERIAACIYDGIIQFKNSERVGYPADLTADKWDEFLDKMLFSFKEISTNYKNDPYEIYFRKQLKKGLDSIDDPSCCELTEIKKASKKYFDKIKEGLSLFSKYYMDLLD